MQPVMSFFGSKWRLAKNYGPPLHDTVIEPFAGGAGYSLYWEPEKVILCEIDPTLYSVWKYIQETPKEEILSLPLVGEFRCLRDLRYLPLGGRNLIGMWLGVSLWSPRQRATSMCLSHLKNNRLGSTWSPAIRSRIAEQSSKIKEWTILNTDYRRLSNVEAHWFIDPPYQVKGKNYVYGKDINYESLAGYCRSRKGVVQVCENEGATWLPFKFLCSGKSINDRLGGNQKSVEVIWELLG